VGFIIHDVLDMKKLSAKLVPKCLNADQKRNHFVGSQVILEHFRRNTAVFLVQLVSMNETGYVCMTQRQKNNLRSGDTVIHLVQKISKTVVSLYGNCIYFLGQSCDTAGRLTRRGYKSHRKLLHASLG